MPNPLPLHRLIQLREAAGLSLSDMAQRCGLSGTQSRKTVSTWETGVAIPRASRRRDFMRYLWHDLHLYQDPAHFDEVWTILVKEWEWEPLSLTEREQLLIEPARPPLVTESSEVKAEAAAATVEIIETEAEIAIAASESIMPEATTADLLSLPAEPVSVVPTADSALPATPSEVPPLVIPSNSFCRLTAIQSWQNWLLITLLLALLGGGWFWWRGSSSVTVIQSQPLATSQPRVTSVQRANPMLPKLINGSFEQPVRFAGWQVHGECDYQTATDSTSAHDGERYLAIQNRLPGCDSFYQDVFMPLEAGVTYRAAIWLRSATGNVRRGHLALWAPDAESEYHSASFAVGNLAWTCLETTLIIQHPGHNQLRFEVYLDSYDGLAYHFDSAVLTQGDQHLCPSSQLAIADLQLVQPSGQIYPGATVGVQAMVENVGVTALAQAAYIRYWVSEWENGEPLDAGAIRGATIPPLAAGESATIPHVDLYLPINLPAKSPYFLVADVVATERLDDFTPDFDRISHLFAAIPCEQGTLYCDVPADHWAATEIQAWFDAKISQGCRSDTEPFLNRPFCPDGVVQRWMMAFFLLRRLEGADYQPTTSYQGLFEDVPEDFSYADARWIEALVTQRVDLQSDACPPRGEHLRFCPTDPLRRVDFARALLELQRWELADIAGTFFVDMAAGTIEARAAEYMWQQGYLPENDTDCPKSTGYRRFCPNAPLRRASAAVMMSRALGLTE